MMEREKDEPFVRESWQRLLREGDDVPSEATDLRIHTEARRALASRPVRWWVPTSLAASFVLVVMLVQSQYAGLSREQSIGESEVALDQVPTKPSLILHAAPGVDETEATGVAPAAPPDAAVPDQGFLFSPPADAVPPPRVDLPAPMMDQPPTAVVGQPPAREEREASELKRERADSPAPLEQAVVAPPREEKEAITVTGSRSTIGNLVASKVAAEDTRTPEAWYAEIEALRDAGRIEEAEAELKKLEAAHPDWLAKHHPPKP